MKKNVLHLFLTVTSILTAVFEYIDSHQDSADDRVVYEKHVVQRITEL